MDPNEWNASDDHDHLYQEVLRRSQERFFTCECRFGTFKLRSALENVFLIQAHDCARVHTLTYEKLRIPFCDTRKYIPDFLVNSQYIVECKAVASQRDGKVLRKAEAAERYAEQHELTYVMLDYEDFDDFFALI